MIKWMTQKEEREWPVAHKGYFVYADRHTFDKIVSDNLKCLIKLCLLGRAATVIRREPRIVVWKL